MGRALLCPLMLEPKNKVRSVVAPLRLIIGDSHLNDALFLSSTFLSDPRLRPTGAAHVAEFQPSNSYFSERLISIRTFFAGRSCSCVILFNGSSGKLNRS
jgi:hypothetical protein